MDAAFLAPTLVSMTPRLHARRVRGPRCAASAPHSSSSGDLIGPRRRPREATPSPSLGAERDVVEALRPSRAEMADAHRMQLRQAARAERRAKELERVAAGDTGATVLEIAEPKDIKISSADSASPSAAEARVDPPMEVTLSAGNDAPVVAAVGGTTKVAINTTKSSAATTTATQTRIVDEMLEQEVTASWTRKGRASAVSRTVEIWWFFFRMVTGELKIRKMEDAKQMSEARSAHAAKLKHGLLALGPTFIKLGQLLSTRVDIVPKEYIEELSSLQDRVPGFSGARAIEVIEKDFGRPIGELYDSFDPVPIAAASLGQVHRAVYQGREVAIKIQRAGLKELFDVDLKNLKVLAKMLDKFDPKNDGASRNWVQIYDESAKLLYEEIDYVKEGRNADRFRNNFKGVRWVKVPKVYWDLTSERVLTMEYVPGIKINDYEAIEKAGLDRKVLASRSAESYLTQLLRHGYFHTDPHCGNLAVDSVAGGRIIYYDFGMMSAFEPHIKRGLVEVIFGIYEGNAKDICDAMVGMGVLSGSADRITVEKVGRYFLGLFRTNLDAGNRKKSKEEKRAEMSKRLDSIGEDLLAVSEDECFNFPPVFTFVFRAFTTLEGIGKGLDAKYDLTALAGPYLKELIDLKDGSATVTAIKSFQKRVGWRGKDLNALVTQPRKTAYIEETLRRMESGDLRLRVRVLESERMFKRVSLAQGNMSLTLVASTFANMAVVLSTAGEQFAIHAKLVWLLAVIVTVRLIIGLLKFRSVESRLKKYTRGSF